MKWNKRCFAGLDRQIGWDINSFDKYINAAIMFIWPQNY